MTLQQMEYVLAIAQEGSMTKAARKLYKAQPNISNAIQELESELHISIFERSSKGMILTPEGEEFIGQANDIVQQTKRLQNYFCQRETTAELMFRIAVARSSYMTTAVSEWINNTFSENQMSMQVHFTETNTNKVIEAVASGHAELGIIRIPSDYQNFYNSILENKRLFQKTLMEFPMRIVLKKDHPLASCQDISYEQLAEYTEIIHGDDQFPIIKQAQINKSVMEQDQKLALNRKQVFVYDRGSQISLLDKIKDSYMWVSPIPLYMLDMFGMIIKDCSYAENMNSDIIISKYDQRHVPHVQNCMNYLLSFAEKLQYEVEHRKER